MVVHPLMAKTFKLVNLNEYEIYNSLMVPSLIIRAIL